jgi:hypothetical protein
MDRNVQVELSLGQKAATINAKNASFPQKIVKRNKRNHNFINKI